MYKGSMKVWFQGQELELLTIGQVGKMLKRSVETIRMWERNKIIPKPMYRAKNKVRLYHPREVEVMKKVLRKHGKYANQEALKTAMWEALYEIRKELIGERQQS